MEQEIDLRPYIEAFGRNLIWIIGAGILAALIALGASFLAPPSYEATALVAVTVPRQKVQFDPRITLAEEAPPFDAYPELATSDELLLDLLAEVKGIVPEVQNREQLRALLSADAGSDPSLLRLSVQYGKPEEAATVANEWAILFVDKANEVFGGQGSEQLQFFMEQLAKSSEELEQVDEALSEFQSRNRLIILENELLALQQTQADLLAKQRQIVFLIQDAASLQAQLEDAAEGSKLTSADQLAAILLQLRAFSGVPNALTTVPWQLQVTIDQFAEAEREQQMTFLSGLQETLQAQAKTIDFQLVELEPQIFNIQQEKQDAVAEEARLIRKESVSEETFIALSRKVQEEQITSQDSNSGVRLASRSAVPTKPESSSRWILMIVAAIIGVIIAIIVITVRTWKAQNTLAS